MKTKTAKYYILEYVPINKFQPVQVSAFEPTQLDAITYFKYKLGIRQFKALNFGNSNMRGII
jgi:hypothetical protein